MTAHGPWIKPELDNGWEHESWPLRWRIDRDGGLAFTGGARPPDGDTSKPLFKLNSIYRHFFGQTISTFWGDHIVRVTIDEDGWIYATREEFDDHTADQGTDEGSDRAA